jgi:MerR family transcriptional regulator, light-induced transcriptional regulator
MRQTGKDPTSDEFLHNEQSLSMANLQAKVFSGLKQYNTQSAADALRQALNLFGVDAVFSDLIEPILVQVGDEWHKGQISVSDEHFITEFFQEQLLSMLSVTVKPFRIGTIVAGCMPGELHEIGLLMMVILLRMRGWNVIFLGQNLHLDRLDELIRSLNPRLLLFSATLPETASQVQNLINVMRKIEKPGPMVVLGGHGFEEIASKVDIPHPILSGTRAEMINTMERLIDQHIK